MSLEQSRHIGDNDHITPWAVTFREEEEIAEGVVCKCYDFDNDNSRDLGIITIQPWKRTPVQRVLQGERTIEGHISGQGQLAVVHADGSSKVYSTNEFPVVVKVGDVMQLQASGSEPFVVYEICVPPYQDGRFENVG